jgi:hypothetical protein
MKGSVISQISETWQSRAKECRGAAKRLRSAEARRRMLAAAEDFERMAIEAAPSIAPSEERDRWAGMTL